MMLEIEEPLVKAARSGDMAAFEQLYRQTAPKILKSAHRIVGRQDARDLVQDTYVDALTSIARFRGECRVTTWLYRILCNHAFTMKRKATAHPVLPLSSDYIQVPARDINLNIDLQRALAALPAAERRIISRSLEGYSNAEIADELGVSPLKSTIRARICRARQVMQRSLPRA
jgi:RNA polymerase sigma-70 factor (ECF subfamily)